MTITAKSVLDGKWMLQDLGELIDSKVKESDIKERKGAGQKDPNHRGDNPNNHGKNS